MKDEKIIDMPETEQTEIEKDGWMSKVKTEVKKHKKKIAIGAAIGTSLLLGYFLKTKIGHEDFDVVDVLDKDIIDTDNVEIKDI